MQIIFKLRADTPVIVRRVR